MPVPAPQPVFRFAPSPNGLLHLGHAYSALLNRQLADAAGGRLLLRIEDVDRQRARDEFVRAIIDDLAWLGIAFEPEPRRQCEHLGVYQAALDQLDALGLIYKSTISRSAIARLAGADPAWPRDPDGAPHPPSRFAEQPDDAASSAAIRLDMRKAMALAASTEWMEQGQITQLNPAVWGDVVLRSRDGVYAYHLAVVVDDAAQGISHIVRGRDLYAATAIHRVLQNVLGLPAPLYHHHELILDSGGMKLAKSRQSPTLQALRAEGVSPRDVRRQLGFAG
ncbi:MAG: tRNA glutamyl-Q(34) synthetase GluQRS [Phyllobacteriaceae bacterium]|nr:tRNA glutamyl-Q(34) synthetase GluQRS [Phyllobacteriaceae bacterium]